MSYYDLYDIVENFKAHPYLWSLCNVHASVTS